jgi:hypothetical protein
MKNYLILICLALCGCANIQRSNPFVYDTLPKDKTIDQIINQRAAQYETCYFRLCN